MNQRPYRTRNKRRLLNLDGSCTYHLVSLANQISSLSSQAYRAEFGLGVMEWRCLAFIALEEEISAASICELSKIDKALVSRTLKKLEALGFVERSSANVRPRPVRLTPAGNQLHDDMLERAIASETSLRKNLSAREIREFLRIATKMQHNIDHITQPALIRAAG